LLQKIPEILEKAKKIGRDIGISDEVIDDLILGAPCSLSGQVPLIVRTRFNSRLNREANIRDYHSG